MRRLLTADRRMLAYRVAMASSAIVVTLVGTTPTRRLALCLAYGYIGRRMVRPIRAQAWLDASRRYQEARAAQDAHIIPTGARQAGR